MSTAITNRVTLCSLWEGEGGREGGRERGREGEGGRETLH